MTKRAPIALERFNDKSLLYLVPQIYPKVLEENVFDVTTWKEHLKY